MESNQLLTHIRPMGNSDVEAIVKIEAAAHEFPWTLQIFRDCIKVGYLCYVVAENTNILGFVVASVAANECHILNITIKPESQRRGLGEELLKFILIQAQQHHAHKVFLEVRISNTSAIKLYEKIGFDILSIRRNYYPANDGREDALVMVKDLNV